MDVDDNKVYLDKDIASDNESDKESSIDSQDSDFNSSFKGSQSSESVIDFENELTSGKSNIEGFVSKTSDMRCSENEYFVDAESILERFSKWMESVDGGEKKLDNIVQNVSQVRKIIQAVDPSEGKIESLFQRDDVRDKWFAPFKKSNRQPGTVRSYCNSLRLFMDFLIASKLLLNHPVTSLTAMQTQAKSWSKCLNKQVRRREYQKIYEDYDNITNPEQVQFFLNSDFSKFAVNVIEGFSSSNVKRMPTKKEYTDVRDFLFWHLSVDNGSRPGPICDLTLGNFHAAKTRVVEDKKGDKKTCHVIYIFDHKTAPTHGPAQLVFNEVLHRWFQIFILNIRGKYHGLPQDDSSHIFVTHDGSPMISKQMSGRLTSLWRKGLGKNAVK